MLIGHPLPVDVPPCRGHGRVVGLVLMIAARARRKSVCAAHIVYVAQLLPRDVARPMPARHRDRLLCDSLA